MDGLTDKERKVLGCFSGGCESIGKVRGISDSVWFALQEKGLIENCDCCDDSRSFVITAKGSEANK